MNNDMRKILRDIHMQILMERHLKEFFGQKESPEDLHRLEHDPRIKTNLTDKDMLMLRIDIALDNRDEVSFNALVRELKGASNG